MIFQKKGLILTYINKITLKSAAEIKNTKLNKK